MSDYTWQATYEDGTVLNEYSPERPDGLSWLNERPPGRIILLALLADGQMRYLVHIPAGAAPVFFWRKVASENDDTGRTYCRCIGWQREGSAAYLFVFNNGETLLTDNFQAV